MTWAAAIIAYFAIIGTVFGGIAAARAYNSHKIGGLITRRSLRSLPTPPRLEAAIGGALSQCPHNPSGDDANGQAAAGSFIVHASEVSDVR